MIDTTCVISGCASLAPQRQPLPCVALVAVAFCPSAYPHTAVPAPLPVPALPARWLVAHAIWQQVFVPVGDAHTVQRRCLCHWGANSPQWLPPGTQPCYTALRHPEGTGTMSLLHQHIPGTQNNKPKFMGSCRFLADKRPHTCAISCSCAQSNGACPPPMRQGRRLSLEAWKNASWQALHQASQASVHTVCERGAPMPQLALHVRQSVDAVAVTQASEVASSAASKTTIAAITRTCS